MEYFTRGLQQFKLSPSHRVSVLALWATIIHSTRAARTSVKNLYHLSPPHITARLLSQSLFSKFRTCLAVQDLDEFCRRLSEVWTRSMTATGIFCVDESLWKFICHTKGTENNDVVRAIPRKPAKMGLLSYELCGFAYHSKLPYPFSIVPVTKTNRPSTTDAAFTLLDLFDRYKPLGTPKGLVCIMDSAFSSSDALTGYEERGWLYSVAINPHFHQDLAFLLGHGLNLFECRMLTDPHNYRIYTAYSTQFQATSKQEQRGTGTGSPLLILNATNAYIMDHKSITQDVYLPEAPLTSSQLLPCLRALYSHPPPIHLSFRIVKEVLSPSSSSSSKSVLKRQRTGSIDSQFISNTVYDSINIGGKTFSRQQVLDGRDRGEITSHQSRVFSCW